MRRRLAEIGRRVSFEQRVAEVANARCLAALSAGWNGFSDASLAEDDAAVATVFLEREKKC